MKRQKIFLILGKWIFLYFTGALLILLCYGSPYLPTVGGTHHRKVRRSSSNTMFQFTAQSYNMSIEENTRGKVVARIDEKKRVGIQFTPCLGCKIRFKIVRGDPERQFRTLHKVIGDFAYLHIRQENDVILNRERTSFYQLIVKATLTRPHYGPVETTTIIYLNVLDQNDLLSRFNEDNYEFEVSKTSQPFSVLGQVNGFDSDEGLNGEVFYSLKEFNEYFYIEPSTGVIRTFDSLPKNTTSEVMLKGFVQDRTSRLFYNNPDMQPQKPSFNSPNEAEIKIKLIEDNENGDKNFKITTEAKELKMDGSREQLIANVLVEGNQNEYKIYISNETGFGEFFSLKPITKNNYEVWLIDRRFWKFFTQLWKNEMLFLDVIGTTFNENNNKVEEIKVPLKVPVKPSSYISFNNIANENEIIPLRVNECLPPGHSIYVFKATPEYDMDEDKIRYRIRGKDKDTLPFAIDHKTGLLTISSFLNATTEKEFSFEVVGKIQGNDSVKCFVNVLLTITPCNSHQPEWDLSFNNLNTMSLGNDELRSGVKLFILKANDKDGGDNGKIHYKIIDKNDSDFVINPLTGDVYFKKDPSPLNNYWILQAIAIDHGIPYSRYSKPLVILLHREGYQVTNDDLKVLQTTKSYFEQKKERGEIKVESVGKLIINEETPIGSRFGQLKVTDVQDNSESSGILFSTSDQYFGIDEYTDSTSPREDDLLIYQLHIRLYDVLLDATNRELGNFSINIHIKDVNNNYPLFDKWEYTYTIPEDSPKDTLIGAVAANDLDHNAGITYKIINKDSNIPLRIDSTTGNIYSLEPFDRENNPILRYVIIATDATYRPLTSFANLTLVIGDVNDNEPQCLSAEPYSVTIPEDLPNNALITCLIGVDKDEGKNRELSYYLIDEKDKKNFFLHQKTGCLFLRSSQPLDYEIQNKYVIKFKISDNGEKSLSTICTLEVLLEDVNENIYPPTFEDVEIEGSIEENMPIGTTVLTIHATDSDNATCQPTYKIIDGDGLGYFEITEGGTIKTTRILDHEKKSLYYLTVAATDCDAKNPLTSVGHVNIKVLNTNDNAPMFLAPVYTGTISEDSPEDTIVCKVEAIDADEVQNTKSSITYTIIKGNFQSQFSIDPRSGHIIRGKRRLDREAQKEYELHVNACDNGTPKLCSTVIVILNVTDVNDNGPIVKVSSYNVTVPAGIKGFLHRVIAIDNDGPEFRESVYSISGASVTGISINEFGEIMSSDEIKIKEDITLEISVKDKLNNSMESVVEVKIKGSNINSSRHPKNKPPQFVSMDQWKVVQLSDSEKLGQAITVLETYDPDGDVLLWEMKDKELKKYFSITNNGELVLLVPVNEIPIASNEFVLPFNVTDGSLTIESEITIRKPKMSIYRPSFSSLVYYIEISEDTPIGSIIFHGSKHLNPIPQDIFMGKRLAYGFHSYESTYTIDKLTIDPTTGNIILLEQIDNDETKNFSVVIFVQLNGKFNYAMVTFSVSDGSKKKLLLKTLKYITNNNNETTTKHPKKSKYLFTYTKDPKKSKHLLIKTPGIVLPTFSISEKILECQPYTIHPVTGLLTLKDSFKMDDFKFSFGICPLQIKDIYGEVFENDLEMRNIDIVNNPPVLSKDIYYGAIYENSPPGSIVYTLESHKEGMPLSVKGIDNDNGVNGMVTYKTVGSLGMSSNRSNEYFSVDMFTGIIRTTMSIDREKSKYQLFYVYAQDLGRPSMISEKLSLVNVTILNINDCQPRFLETNYHFKIAKLFGDGMVVGEVKAVDEDDNSILHYSLSSDDIEDLNFFSINDTNGVITLKNSKFLLKSKRKIFHLKVSSSDSIYTTEEKVKIEIDDGEVTRNGVQFPEKEYKLTIRENESFTKEQSRRPLITLNIPSIYPLSYTLETVDERFYIDKNIGNLYLKEGISFDKETTDSIELIVSARNLLNFNDNTRTKVTIEIEDVNDCQPVFTQTSYEGNVPKDAIYGHRILSIKAIDEDTGSNGMVKYSFTSEVPEFISLNKNDGRVIVSKPISSKYKVGDSFNLTIKAADKGTPSLSSLSHALIKIVDKSLPIFSQNSDIMKVRATSYSNGTIGYFLVNTDEYSSFVVSFETGSIGTKKSLDKEVNDKIMLKIGAVDTSNPKIYSYTDVEVDVVNVNDCQPKFEKNIYRVEVDENLSIGSVLVKVNAFDIDSNSSMITYSLLEEDSIIGIEKETGKVMLLKNLDYETNNYYEFIVKASDEDGFWSEGIIIITVNDINDNEVKILNEERNIVINGRVPKKGDLLYFLTVDDKDTVSNLENNQRFLFTIYEDEDSLFEIDPLNGIIAFGRDLTHEEMEMRNFKKKLNVSVTDGLFTEYCMLTIIFKDLGKGNNNFTFEYPVYYGMLNENNALNTFILQVSAKNGMLPYTYEIVNINSSIFNLPFGINKNDGRITLEDRLDYEIKNKYLIPIKATDKKGLITYTHLNFTVIDSNDNSPKFIYNMKNDLKVSINSNMEVGDYITSILATDDDVKDVLEYSINKDYKEGEYFDIHSRQGLISLAKPVNQLVNQKLKCQVKVSDIANPPHITSINIIIEVLPANVFIPHFSMLKYSFVLFKNPPIGNVVGAVEEKDYSGEVDKDSNRKAYYFMVNEKDNIPFSIDKNSGKIIVKKGLNLITVKEISFPVFISSDSNGNGPASMATVTIQLSYQLDGAPQFFTMDSKYSVMENLPVGTVIGISSAINGDIYEIECKDNLSNLCPFEIDSKVGMIFVSGILDRETKDKYILNVISKNLNGQKGEKEIQIVVEDENDTPSEFVETPREVNIDLNKLTKGAILFTFSIIDKDENSNIFARITEGNAKEIYEIKSIKNDAKEDNIYNFGVLFNGDSKKLLNVKEEYISIVVSDGIHFVEKNFVVIYQNSSLVGYDDRNEEIYLEVKEDAPSGSVILSLKETPRLTIINNEIDKLDFPFAINQKNELMLSKLLDWNKKSYYNFSIKEEVKFVDTYYTYSIINYNVKVIDVNDHTPKFIPNEIVKLNVKENIPANVTSPYFLYKYFARDDDSIENGNVTYSIVNNEGGYFEINPVSGILSLIKPLDKEENDDMKVTVKAEDNNGRFSEIDTMIFIENVNDNAPVFDLKSYVTEVVENEFPKDNILRVHATDKDSGDVLTYKLHGVDEFVSNIIKINGVTGEIYLTTPLDYELIREINFEVQVSDNYDIPQTDIAKIRIIVLDDNDNPPQFIKRSFEVNVKEHTPLGTNITSLKAFDKDSGHYGAILYSLTGDDSKLFKVSEEGDLIVEGDLDYEVLKTLTFEVRAKDGGLPPKTDKAIVKVNIENVNDHPPKFDNCNLTAVIQDGIKSNHPLLDVILTDEDVVDPKEEQKYHLIITGDGGEDFYFDNNLTLKTKKDIVHSKKDKYLLEVTAYDNGNLSSTCPLTIYLKQQSKHPPVVPPFYRFSLTSIMGEFLGKSIGKIMATDGDKNDILIYTIPMHSFEGYNTLPFKIDSQSGDISANPDILEGTYKFPVTVTDGKYTVTTVVTVEVQSINENDLMHSLSIRLSEMNPEVFIKDVKEVFVNKIAEIFRIDNNNVKILSIQPVDEVNSGNRSKRSPPPPDIDVLISIYATKIKDYLRPEFVMKRLEHMIGNEKDNLPFSISSMNHDVCSESTCNEGTCNVKIWLDSSKYNIISGNGSIFTSPSHLRTFTCTCKEGFGGRVCDVPINKCSYKKCTRNEMCIPIYNMFNQSDYVCTCPPGLEGVNCNEKRVCNSEEKCSEYNAISINGGGYFQMSIGKSVEQRLNLVFEFRTISINGTLFYGRGLSDYNYLSIENGHLKYVWNCGTGEGVIKIDKKTVSDGKWHKVKIYRVGRQATIKLDDEYSTQGVSSIGSDVLNLYDNANVLTFGGEVNNHDNPKTIFDLIDDNNTKSRSLINPSISNSIIGCIGKVLLDDFELPKTVEGLKVYNVKMGCETTALGPCIEANCLNGGLCKPIPNKNNGKSYTCSCPERYSGNDCELDLDMCANNPCPPGVKCHSLIDDFFCNCPIGFTGKTCQVRGSWDPCQSKPCGNHGTCIAFQTSFICNCTNGYSGKFCTIPYSRIQPDTWSSLSILDTIFGMALLAVILCSLVFTIYMCKKNSKIRKSVVYNELPNNGNDTTQLSSQLLTKGVISTDNQRITIDFNKPLNGNRSFVSNRGSIIPPPQPSPSNPAPPLPPRAFRNKFNNGTYQNDIPTMPVRPIQSSILDSSIDNDLISHASSRFSRDMLSSPVFNKSRLLLSPLISNAGSIQCLDKSGRSVINDKPSMDLPLLHSMGDATFQETYVTYDGNGKNKEDCGDYMTIKPKKRVNRSQSTDICSNDEMEPLNNEAAPPPLPPHRSLDRASIKKVDKEDDNDSNGAVYDNPNNS
uniref:Cadherin domain-containing protein n=1 Tax=Strongyloides papillosus TaxID=174720 RepID=A0A0N5BTM2_STREA